MKKQILFILLLATAGIVFAQDPVAQRLSHFNITKSGLAMKGYDPVSYHRGKPAKGSAQFTATYLGLKYRFVSDANRKAFETEPAKFEPAYGGWCAWAMLEGDKVDFNPQRFKIIEGRTYLFYDGFFGNTLKKWHKKAEKTPEAEMVKIADQHWQKLINS
jgi:YHS domain-containing protein